MTLTYLLKLSLLEIWALSCITEKLLISLLQLLHEILVVFAASESSKSCVIVGGSACLCNERRQQFMQQAGSRRRRWRSRCLDSNNTLASVGPSTAAKWQPDFNSGGVHPSLHDTSSGEHRTRTPICLSREQH